MSLMKQRTMTEKQKAASRANGRCSRGPTTDRGREQIRVANLRHGLFSQAQEIVLPTLGEDAEKFQELLRGTCEQWPGADPSEAKALAAAMWRMDRASDQLLFLEVRLTREAGGDILKFLEHPSRLRALTIEACASRDFFNISNRLRRQGKDKPPPSTE